MNVKGYRTIAFNVVVGLGWLVMVSTGESTTGEGEEVKGALDMVFDAIPIILVIGNAWFRAITNTSIFKSS